MFELLIRVWAKVCCRNPDHSPVSSNKNQSNPFIYMRHFPWRVFLVSFADLWSDVCSAVTRETSLRCCSGWECKMQLTGSPGREPVAGSTQAVPVPCRPWKPRFSYQQENMNSTDQALPLLSPWLCRSLVEQLIYCEAPFLLSPPAKAMSRPTASHVSHQENSNCSLFLLLCWMQAGAHHDLSSLTVQSTALKRAHCAQLGKE